MGAKIPVAKAARLLGVKRGRLQEMSRRGELPLQEGLVDLDLLRELFPTLALEEVGTAERTRIIRATAFGRRVRETVTPDRDELSVQLEKRMTELAVQKALAEKYYGILQEMAERICTWQEEGDASQRAVMHELGRWLVGRLKEAEQ